MEPHVERMLSEAKELSDRMLKLQLFVQDSAKFVALPQVEQQAMLRQLAAMSEYSAALTDRLSRAGS